MQRTSPTILIIKNFQPSFFVCSKKNFHYCGKQRGESGEVTLHRCNTGKQEDVHGRREIVHLDCLSLQPLGLGIYFDWWCMLLPKSLRIWINMKQLTTTKSSVTLNAHVETSITPDCLKDDAPQWVPARRRTKPTTLNEIQTHNCSAFLHLRVPSNPVTPADTVNPGNLQPFSPIILSLVFCKYHKVGLGLSKTLSGMSSRRERKPERLLRLRLVGEQRGVGQHRGCDGRHASSVYLFYCCGNTFLLLQAAANTIWLFLLRVTL